MKLRFGSLMILTSLFSSVAVAAAAQDTNARVASVDDGSSAPTRVGRIGVELLSGAAGAAAGAALGMLFAMPCQSSTDFSFKCNQEFATGMLIGSNPAASIGIYAVGNAMRGNGGYGWTLLGTSGGSMIAAFAALMLDLEILPTGLLIGTGSVLGGIFGYEASSDGIARPDAPAPTVRARAGLSASRHGASLTLVGSF